jgi:predicted nucleic acid-binding protein
MNYIVDANVIFSALISGKSHYSLFFSKHTAISTDFIFVELEKYRKKILKKSKLSEEELFDFTVNIFKHLTIIPTLSLSASYLEEAYDWCEGIDSKDVLYIALTLQMQDAIFITRDNVLYEGLKSKGFDKIKLFHEVFDH